MSISSLVLYKHVTSYLHHTDTMEASPLKSIVHGFYCLADVRHGVLEFLVTSDPLLL